MKSLPRRALIVVDMSVEQMATVDYKAQQVIDNCLQLVQAKNAFQVRIDSRLWLRDPSESSLSWVYPETAKTLFVAGSEGASLIPELRNQDLVFVEKINYSCFARSKLLAMLQQHEITHVVLCGINTDYCVFATAMDAFGHHFRVSVVQDAVSSYRGQVGHEEGLRNLERHFGPQVLVTTKEALQG